MYWLLTPLNFIKYGIPLRPLLVYYGSSYSRWLVILYKVLDFKTGIIKKVQSQFINLMVFFISRLCDQEVIFPLYVVLLGLFFSNKLLSL